MMKNGLIKTFAGIALAGSVAACQEEPQAAIHLFDKLTVSEASGVLPTNAKPAGKKSGRFVLPPDRVYSVSAATTDKNLFIDAASNKNVRCWDAVRISETGIMQAMCETGNNGFRALNYDMYNPEKGFAHSPVLVAARGWDAFGEGKDKLHTLSIEDLYGPDKQEINLLFKLACNIVVQGQEQHPETAAEFEPARRIYCENNGRAL